MKGNWMVQACKTHGSDEESIQNFCQEKLKERVRLYRGSFGRIILKLHVVI